MKTAFFMISDLIENLILFHQKNKLRYKKRFAEKLKKEKNIDKFIHSLHDNVFKNIDCLECANCCKSISPIITYNDVNRIAKYLKIKPSSFVDKYLKVDNENDYVYKITPCPFLNEDNYCKIYDARPKACREYPHTNRVNFHQITDLTIQNCKICPAVYLILEKI